LQEDPIAKQALKALQLRRLLDCGELTNQQYLDQLNALKTAPVAGVAPPPTAEGPRKTGNSKSGQVSNEPQSRLTGALELLRLRRHLDPGQLTSDEYLAKLNARPGGSPEAAQKPASIDAITPAGVPAPPAPAILGTPAIPERSLAMRCPRCAADLSIYDQMAELECINCGAKILVERKDCTIALRAAEEQQEKAASIAATAASAKSEEELTKLRAEAARVLSVKRSAVILGGLCGVVFGYMGIVEVAARELAMGVSILFCSSALLGTVVYITRQTTRMRAQLNARILAITANDQSAADHP